MFALYTFNKGRFTFYSLFNNRKDALTERDYLKSMLGVDSRLFRC
jgi:hypothetical protein